ncbi:uncharacterized protein LOC131695058 [Topomyia yanbarensis]|uniref:uncharacterized protein LOC131695058 n=1 Tax=Topomyia yanbarensis TaxID=2498891 RepID=UPI00273CE3E0|nr:uncharacterized protein LOC131695058 [Topomyia yanbarensis]
MPPRGPKSSPMSGGTTGGSPPTVTAASNGSSAANGTTPSASLANTVNAVSQQPSPVIINELLEQAMTSLRREFDDDFRKLKAIIVKHENRIRSLEANQKVMADRALTETDGPLLNTSTPSPTIAAANLSAQDDHHGDGSGHYPNTHLAPDEV